MTPEENEKLIRSIKSNFKKSQAETKHCYYPGCKQTPIQSHSISRKRVLDQIAEKGTVLMLKPGTWLSTGKLATIGINQASTLKSFCCNHDRTIFAPIDNVDYVVDNKEQEFLFAFRAAARELLIKEAAVQACQYWKTDYVKNSQLAIAISDATNNGQKLSVKDQNKTRAIFIDTYLKQKYNVIRTAHIILNNWYPVAASGSFNLEINLDGNLINNVLESGYNTEMKPCFLTIFPQGDKTYCLVSYFNKDRKAYSFLNSINDKSDQEKGVIVSNLLVGYVENFVIAPSYWQSFPGKDTFFGVLATAIAPHTKLIENPNFNLFIPNNNVSEPAKTNHQ